MIDETHAGATHASRESNPTTVRLDVVGMTCGHCKASVETSLAAVPGVDLVTVDLDGGTASVAGEGVTADALVAAVKAAGYQATPSDG